MKTKLTFFFLTVLFYGCKLPTVVYFNTQPFIKAYKVDIDKTMTIAYDSAIPDSFVIKSPGINKMNVRQFRQTLEDAMKNTFGGTYNEVRFDKDFSKTGTSLVFVKVNPSWNKKSSKTTVTGSGGTVTSSTIYELETIISYQAILYSEGEKIGVLDGIAHSEKTTFKRNKTPEVLQDGLKVMCEEVYKKTIAFKAE